MEVCMQTEWCSHLHLRGVTGCWSCERSRHTCRARGESNWSTRGDLRTNCLRRIAWAPPPAETLPSPYSLPAQDWRRPLATTDILIVWLRQVKTRGRDKENGECIDEPAWRWNRMIRRRFHRATGNSANNTSLCQHRRPFKEHQATHMLRIINEFSKEIVLLI